MKKTFLFVLLLLLGFVLLSVNALALDSSCSDGLDNDNDNTTDTNDTSCTLTGFENKKPIARANGGENFITATDSDGNGFETVTLDGSSSFELDNGQSIINYTWTFTNTGVFIGEGQIINASFAVGTHNVTLIVQDDSGAGNSFSDPDDFLVTVNPQPVQCNDGLDNDNDSFTDFPNDSGCFNSSDNSEYLPPVANAGPDFSVPDLDNTTYNEQVTLNGSLSSGPIVNYTWALHVGSTRYFLGEGEVITTLLGLGSKNISLTVTDNVGAKSVDYVNVTVLPQCNDGIDNDNDAFIDYPNDNGCFGSSDDTENIQPVANSGPDINVTDSDGGGFETVTLNGSRSVDSDNGQTIINYTWIEKGDSNILLGETEILNVNFSVGVHNITLVVTDSSGHLPTQQSSYGYLASPFNASGNSSLIVTVFSAPAPQCSDGVDNDGDGTTDTGPFGVGDIVCRDAGDTSAGNASHNSENFLCRDSDSGLDFLTGGNTYGYTYNNFFQTNDTCLDQFTLFERSCTTATFDSTTVQIPMNTTFDCRDLNTNSTSYLCQPTTSAFNPSAYCKLTQCSDGLDNDGDGTTDFGNDLGCSNYDDDNETVIPECNDGLDNDNDGLTDLFDTGCTNSADNSENSAPVVNAGSDQTILDSDASGSEEVTLNGSGSSDDQALNFTWTENPIHGTTETVTTNLSVGVHNITLTVTDTFGLTASDEVIVTVTAPQCNDTTDNDNDTLIDFPLDPGCTNTADNDENDTAISPPSNPPGGGGGGGGSGRGRGRGISQNVNLGDNGRVAQFANPGDSFNFNFNNQQYTLTINRITNEGVTVTVNPLGITQLITEGSELSLDLNNDGVNDFELENQRNNFRNAELVLALNTNPEEVEAVELINPSPRETNNLEEIANEQTTPETGLGAITGAATAETFTGTVWRIVVTPINFVGETFTNIWNWLFG